MIDRLVTALDQETMAEDSEMELALVEAMEGSMVDSMLAPIIMAQEIR